MASIWRLFPQIQSLIWHCWDQRKSQYHYIISWSYLVFPGGNIQDLLWAWNISWYFLYWPYTFVRGCTLNKDSKYSVRPDVVCNYMSALTLVRYITLGPDITSLSPLGMNGFVPYQGYYDHITCLLLVWYIHIELLVYVLDICRLICILERMLKL